MPARAGEQPGVDAAAWPCLMGDRTGSRLLADTVGFKYAYDKQSGQFAHDAVTFVLTPEAEEWRKTRSVLDAEKVAE